MSVIARLRIMRLATLNTAAALVHELLQARDERRLLRCQKQMAKYKLLIIDELGFMPLSNTGLCFTPSGLVLRRHGGVFLFR